MKVLTPKTLEEALDLMAGGNGGPPPTPIAGGTDLLVSWHHRSHDDMTLLDLSRLRGELKAHELTEDWLVLGALTSYWDIIADERVSSEFPLLNHAAREVGAIQIQTRGTWAGNIGNGSPAADGVPVMMAYDAVVELSSRDGKKEVPLDSFWSGYKQSVRRPDQLITAIKIPRREREFQRWHKVGSRSAQAIAKVGAALVKDGEGWHVVANSVAPYVLRCRNMEKALEIGHAFDSPEAVQRVIARDVKPIDDLRSTAAYRLKVLSRIVYFGLTEAGAPLAR